MTPKPNNESHITFTSHPPDEFDLFLLQLMRPGLMKYLMSWYTDTQMLYCYLYHDEIKSFWSLQTIWHHTCLYIRTVASEVIWMHTGKIIRVLTTTTPHKARTCAMYRFVINWFVILFIPWLTTIGILYKNIYILNHYHPLAMGSDLQERHVQYVSK